MSQIPETPPLSDCDDSNIGEGDTDNESGHSSIQGLSGDENLSECEIKPQKTIEECLNTIENLERTCSELHDKCKQQSEQLETVSKKYGIAVKEKELMVMRYAVGEKSVLDLKSSKESIEKKLRDACRDNEILQHKVSAMAMDKTRICQMFDDKVYDLKCSNQELEKVKVDLSTLETKLKWSQSALKTEKDLRKESDMKLESLRAQIQEYVNESEQAKRESQEAIKAFHHSQENRANVLEQQLKEQQATLILLRHEKEDKDKQISLLQIELQNLQSKEKGTSDENSTTLAKLWTLEKEHFDLTNRVGHLQSSEEALQKKTAEVQHLTLQLEKALGQEASSVDEIDCLKQQNLDLETDLNACRERESDLLKFTQQLTNKNVQLQSDFTAMETKLQQLKCEQAILKRTSMDYEGKVDLLTKQLVNDRYKYAAENADLSKQLEGKSKLCEKLTQEVADQQGEKSIIKRKLELSLKEVNKELQNYRKQIDQYENASSSSNSSSSSLNTMDHQLPSTYSDGDQVKVIQPELTLDKKALVEHIVKLQRISARKSEKIDFLEEHVNTLVAELQRKTHLLQGYIIREQTGTLTSNKMDKNKANIAKLNGIMASVYGSRVADDNLTLEFSLEINRKLQAVLEDALLKNITLKENIDTLGAEIERLNSLLKSTYTNTVNT